MKDRTGAIVIPKLTASRLAPLAAATEGKYATVTAGNQDIQSISLKPSKER